MSPIAEKHKTGPLCVYITSRGHSGSTILEMLLNRFPQIAAVGEIDQFPLQIVRDGIATKWVGQCSCEARPPECEIWGEVCDRVSSDRGINLAEAPFDFPVSDVGLAQEYGWGRPAAKLKRIANRVVRGVAHALRIRLPGLFPYQRWVRNRDFIYRVVADKRGVTAIVDSSKDAMQMSDLAHYSELDVKVLFLTRDVRGNVWSAIRRHGVKATDEARNWVAVNSRIYSRLERIPNASWMQIKYEDLCTDTDATLIRIMKFIGIDGRQVTPAEERARRHTIAGNQVRFAPLETIRHDLSWQKNLSTTQMDEIRKVAGPMASKLNYEI